MVNIIKKINIEKILILFLLLQPFVDLGTSLMVRFLGSGNTIGVYIKILFFMFLLLYNFITYKYPKRKVSTIFISLYFLYEVIYLLLCINNKGFQVLFPELKASFKAFYTPLILCLLYDVFRNENIKLNSNVLTYVLLGYTFNILLANITGTAFNTYDYGKAGSIGWYFAGNDIGTILISLFPILYYSFTRKKSWISYLILIIVVYIIFTIGTKVPVLGLCLILGALFFVIIINYFIDKNKNYLKKNITNIFILLFVVILLMPNSLFISNIKTQYNNLKQNEVINKENEKQNNGNSSNNNDDNDESTINNLIFSSRTVFLKDTQKRYNVASMEEKIIGMGYFSKKHGEYKLIEMDHFDLFYNHGILGTLLYTSIFVFVIINIIKELLKIGIKKSFNLKNCCYAISVVLLFGISIYSGHVLLNPSVGIYLSIILICIISELNCLSAVKRKVKKIAIMALHLKFGGVEKFITTTADFLSEKYDVEIISTYQFKPSDTFKIKDNIKVTYLLDENLLPNKAELIYSIKNFKIVSIIKNLFISIKIMLLKKLKMIEYIKRSDADLIISTRTEHNYILSEYANAGVTKIVTEHNFYNKQYSKNVVNSCFDIDYFIVSTNIQRDYYTKIFLYNNTKIICIPFALDDIPDNVSSLNTNNIISVGRLSKEKGYSDLIDIFNLVVKENKLLKLHIIGDGAEREKIESKIEELNLSNNIKLHGLRNKDYINKKLKDSSIYVMASHIESFGIVLIEAMSYGIPCIIFDDAKGACEIIKNKENGYIISDRDKKEFADKILYLMNNRDILEQMGKNAKKCSENYNIDNIKQQWYNIIG